MVKAIADGITLHSNDSFGTDGKPFAFNFNADFVDDEDSAMESDSWELGADSDDAAGYSSALIDVPVVTEVAQSIVID